MRRHIICTCSHVNRPKYGIIITPAKVPIFQRSAAKLVEKIKVLWLRRLIYFLLHPGDQISQRVIHAGLWVFALQVANRLFGLTRTIVLARVLSPNDFGLFGIALLALSALNTFSQTGFQQALIQKKGDIRPYLDTAWTVQVIRGVVLAGILFGIAPYVASFFGEPAAALLLRVLGLSAVFQGFTNIGVVHFQKELEFHKRFIYMFSGTLADLGVAISAALILRNAWALVFGLLAGNFVRMVVSYFIRLYRPRLGFDKQQFKQLFGFGKWILASSVIMFLVTQGDGILVGKLLGMSALGFYQLAYRISNMPVTEITQVISQVTFPAYSKLQDSVSKLRSAYFNVLQLTAFISMPLAGLVFVLAPDFTKIFLGKKWLPMVPAMQVLGFLGAIRAIGATLGPVYNAKGRPDYPAKFNLVRLVFVMILISPLTIHFGIVGTALTVLLATFVQNVVLIYYSSVFIQAALLDFGKNLLPPLCSTICMAVGALFVKAPCANSIYGLFVAIAIGISIYLSSICIASKLTGYPIFKTVKEVFDHD